MALSKQMEMFEDGGLKDEGGMTDEVSGNDVPSGSTREEVRDDIPAQLSEGEFVFPADVVRFIGLEKLMMLRQEAKQGLKQMEAMGQMGNSEEATMPDDMPFDINDLDMEEEVDNESDMGYNRGGVIEAQQGTFVQNPITLGQAQFRNEGIDPNIQGMQQIQPNLARGVYQPNLGRMYGGQGYQQQQPVSFKDLLGTSAEGPPQTELVSYYNEKTGQTRMIPHLVNADGTRGESIYPIPEGFGIKEPTKEEEEKKQQPDPVSIPSTMSQESDTGDDDSGVSDLGGARTTIGKEEYAISYGLDGTVSLTSVSEYNKTGKINFTQVTPAIATAIKNQTIGQITQLGKAFGLTATAAMEIAKKMGIDTPRYDKLGNKITKGRDATTFLKNIKTKDEKAIFGREVGMFSERQGFDSMSRRDMERLEENMKKGGTEKYDREDLQRLAINSVNAKAAAEEREKEAAEERKAYLAEIEAQKTATEQKRQADNIAAAKVASKKAYDAMLDRQRQEQDNNNNDDDGSQTAEDQSSVADQQDGMFTAVGGLADKKKLILRKRQPKKNKRMKKGGLASKK